MRGQGIRPALASWAMGNARKAGHPTLFATTQEMTADDELVLMVETLHEPDQPVVVVTDDAELRRRLARHGVDLLDTTSFAWLLR